MNTSSPWCSNGITTGTATGSNSDNNPDDDSLPRTDICTTMDIDRRGVASRTGLEIVMTMAVQQAADPVAVDRGGQRATVPRGIRPSGRPLAVAGRAHHAPSGSVPAVLRRVLSDQDQATLRARCIALNNRIDAAAALTPDPFGGQLVQPLLDPVTDVSSHIRRPAAYDLAGETAILDRAEERIALIERFLQSNNALFAALNAVYLTEPTATRATLFADVQPTMRKMGAQLIDGSLRTSDLVKLKVDLEEALIPQGNKELQGMGRGDAAVVVQKMIRAGMATVDKWTSAYASEYDRPEDNFGGSWKLQATASGGKFQWVRTWEFHVHARVVRANGPGTPVTGFTIHRAHIKPSVKERETGASIVVDDAAVLNAIQNNAETVRRIANWAETGPGKAALKKIK